MPTPTRPTDKPAWGASAVEIATPPSVFAAIGWITQIKPLANFMNFIYKNVSDWIEHISTTSSFFFSVDDAITGLTVDQFAHVLEDDQVSGPGVVLVTKTMATSTVSPHIDSSGDFVLIINQDAANPAGILVNRDLDEAQAAGTPIATYTLANLAASFDVTFAITDGVTTIIGYTDGAGQSYVEAFNALTGTQLWEIDFGTTFVIDGCFFGTSIAVLHSYNAAATGDLTAERTIHAFNSAGAGLWSYKHGTTVDTGGGICSDGIRLYVAPSVASTFASAATLRSLRASDGADFDNESGSTLVDPTGRAWNSTAPTSPAAAALETDGARVYKIRSTDVEAFAAGDGALLWTEGGGLSLTVDQDYVIHGTGTSGEVLARDPCTGAVLWSSTGGPAAVVLDIVSDGNRLWLTANDTEVQAVSRGNSAHLFRRIDTTVTAAPYRRLKLQPQVR